jgi:hypothetical protein
MLNVTLGPWTPSAERTHSGNPDRLWRWAIVRPNSAAPFGREYLQTPIRPRRRYFYSEAAAQKECARLNAANGVGGTSHETFCTPESKSK